MDRNQADRSFIKGLQRLDRALAQSSGREPITDYDRYLFTAEVPYEDAVVEALVIAAYEKLEGEYRGTFRYEERGPWVVFKVKDILKGDPEALICPGASVLARWDRKTRTYKKYIYKEDPNIMDYEIRVIASLTRLSEKEIVEGK